MVVTVLQQHNNKSHTCTQRYLDCATMENSAVTAECDDDDECGASVVFRCLFFYHGFISYLLLVLISF